MKLKFHSDFKKDYLRVRQNVDSSKRLDKELKTVIDAFQAEGELPGKYITNKIISDGLGWHECFVYQGRKHNIIMQYKIEKQCVVLARIGTPSELTKKRKFFLK